MSLYAHEEQWTPNTRWAGLGPSGVWTKADLSQTQTTPRMTVSLSQSSLLTLTLLAARRLTLDEWQRAHRSKGKLNREQGLSRSMTTHIGSGAKSHRFSLILSQAPQCLFLLDVLLDLFSCLTITEAVPLLPNKTFPSFSYHPKSFSEERMVCEW